MENTIVQATTGAIVGWTMGASRLGRPSSSPLGFYDPVPLRMAPSPALDAWIVACRAIKREIALPLLAGQYAAGWRYSEGAAGFGLANIERGVPPPLCGALDNPLSASSGAMGRAVFWGLVFNGSPASVLAALWDACYDHDKEGVWCAAAVAWLVAHAGQGFDRKELVASLVSLLPPGADISRAWPIISTFFGQGDSALHIRNGVRDLGLSEAGVTLVEICAAYGQSTRFGSGLGNAVVGDGHRPTAGLVVGALEALEYGEVPSDWAAPLGESYVVGHGLAGIDAPATLADFCQMVVGAKLMSSPAVSDVVDVEPVEVVASATPVAEEPKVAPEAEPAVPVEAVVEPAVPVEPPDTGVEAPAAEDSAELVREPKVETAPEEVAASATPVEPEPVEAAPAPVETTPSRPVLTVPAGLRSRMADTKHSCFAALADLDLMVRYIDSPKAVPGRGLALDLQIKARGTKEVETHASVAGPPGWPLASRLQEFRAQPNTIASFPTLLQIPETWDRMPASLRVTLNETEVGIPILPEDDWAAVGPFANGEGMGHDKVYTPEKLQEAGQTFGSRSGLIVHWERWNSRDFEGIVSEQPGVIYLFTELIFPRPAEITVICGIKGAVKLWLGDKLVINCRDSRGVDVENPGAFAGTADVGSTARCLIKISRGSEPVGPLTLVFRDEVGAVIFPSTKQKLVSR